MNMIDVYALCSYGRIMHDAEVSYNDVEKALHEYRGGQHGYVKVSVPRSKVLYFTEPFSFMGCTYDGKPLNVMKIVLDGNEVLWTGGEWYEVIKDAMEK